MSGKLLVKIQQTFTQLPGTRRLWVGYSGGLDSRVLLQISHEYAREKNLDLVAIHVNHGLNPLASDWSLFCQNECNQLGIPLEVIAVDARHPAGESPENWARIKRYEAFRSRLQDGDILLTAHHQNDQAETLMLQLLRGGGPHGLAAMPELIAYGSGWHARPLLYCSRSELQSFAESHHLGWVEDESNLSLRYDRNYLRQLIFPLLEQRWPSAISTISRSATWQAHAAELLDEVAEADFRRVAADSPSTLDVNRLCEFSVVRLNNVLRYWFVKLGLPLPSACHIERIIKDILYAAWDATPLVCWPGVEVRRYRNRIYAALPLTSFDTQQIYPWDFSQNLSLPHGILVAKSSLGVGLSMAACRQGEITVRFRQGGEACRPIKRKHTQLLKHLFQAYGVPPWQRTRIPLIYLNDSIAALPGYFVCEPYAVSGNEDSWQILWSGN